MSNEVLRRARAVVVPLGLLSMACPGGQNVQNVPPSAVNAQAGPACSHDDGSDLLVPGFIGAIPEYHDCQGFRAPSTGAGPGTAFVAKYAVFVRGELDNALALAATAAGAPAPPAPVGRHAAVLPPALVTARQHLATGLTIGLVWAGADWPRLKIKQGFNCLVLQTPATGGYAAYMIPVKGNSDSTCLQSVLPLPSGQQLDVQEMAVAVPSSDIPPHARWDLDGNVNKQDPYIIVKCPSGICEIFEKGPVSAHSPSLPEVAPPSATAAEKRILMAKLWFDDQVLATPNPLGGIVAGGPRGTLFPHPDLDSYSETSFTPGRWLPTAGVRVVGGNPSDYRKKLGVEPGPRPDWVRKSGNIFHMCTDTLFSGGGVAPGNPCGAADSTRARCPNSHFYARMKVNDSTKAEFCVMHTQFPAGTPVRGVTRWHFLDKDDTVWWRCPRGCCEVQLL